MIKIFSCIKFIALIFLCCVSIKYGHWLLAFFMLLIGGAYCSDNNTDFSVVTINKNKEVK